VKRPHPRRPAETLIVCRILPLLLGLATCAGCSSRDCPEAPPGQAWYSPLTAPALGTDGALAIAKRRQGQAIEILCLSGGGQVGAFGAGILNGWSKSGRRPKFDIVAGVSTGAIIATFAFLGGPEDDDQVRSAYLDITDADVFEKRFILAALVSDSLNSTEPFKRTLLRMVPDALIDRVAVEGAADRQLWIGTLNLDRGAMVAWDMTKLAMEAKRTGDSKLYDRYRTILLASASVPVLFPPVMIDGAMYIDGSTRELIFLEHILSPVFRVYADIEKVTPGAPRPALYAIINAKIGVPYECVADNMQAIATRSVEVAIDESTLGNIYRMKGLADWHHLDWRFTRLPDSATVPDNHNAVDPDAMKKLYELGVQRGGDPATWETTIPEPSGAGSPAAAK
jgi:hypothetical protein